MHSQTMFLIIIRFCDNANQLIYNKQDQEMHCREFYYGLIVKSKTNKRIDTRQVVLAIYLYGYLRKLGQSPMITLLSI